MNVTTIFIPMTENQNAAISTAIRHVIGGKLLTPGIDHSIWDVVAEVSR